MAPWVQTVVQGLAGVGCIVLAVVLLGGDKNVVAFTAVSGFGFSLLGNLVKGPGQETLTADERKALSQFRASQP